MIKDVIGETAGKVWCELRKKGGLSIRDLSQAVKCKSSDAQMATGWLAREGKVVIWRKGNKVIVTLTGEEPSIEC